MRVSTLVHLEGAARIPLQVVDLPDAEGDGGVSRAVAGLVHLTVGVQCRVQVASGALRIAEHEPQPTLNWQPRLAAQELDGVPGTPAQDQLPAAGDHVVLRFVAVGHRLTSHCTAAETEGGLRP